VGPIKRKLKLGGTANVGAIKRKLKRFIGQHDVGSCNVIQN